jgi:ABC-type antimicrobial peptide transport system permease subunit
MFSFPLVEGSVQTALSSNDRVVITQSFAKKLFGNENAMGKIVKIDSVDNLTVTGVMKDLPNNTEFQFDYLLPWSYMNKIGWNDSDWQNNSVKTFVLLKQGASPKTFDAKVKNVTIDHTKGDGQPATTQVFTQPLADGWLYSTPENGQYVTGRIEMVKLFAIIAAFILLIACINFMNLSTARSEKRAKEVGIRKVAGAKKRLLITQFIGESILFAFLAFILALIIVEISLPGFNDLVDKNLFIDFGNGSFWLFA